MRLDSARHAFVTGGASGIGLGIAEALMAQGICVTIADVSVDALEAALATRRANLRGAYLDVRDRLGWAAAKTEAEKVFGPVDILVNNAGVAPDGRDLADMEPGSFDLIVAINLTGVFNGILTFAADLRSRGRGHIVNTASMAGISSALPAVGAYAATKFAVVGLSETLRRELAPYGVGVSVLCPGFVATGLMENSAKLGVKVQGRSQMISRSSVMPRDVGAVVLKGIGDNAPYILTHADDWWPRVEARLIEIGQAFRENSADPLFDRQVRPS